MKRLNQVVLIVSMVVGAWLGMEMVHEFGHVLGAWVSGGKVVRVVLYPLGFSRTDVGENPWPLVVVWGGPMVGVLAPVVLWGGAVLVRVSWAFLLRFFAGFCLVANGVYIGVGAFGGVGDCGEMLRRGSAGWELWLFGLVATALGLALWHGQAKYFGLGREALRVRSGVAVGSLVVSAGLLVLGFVVGGR